MVPQAEHLIADEKRLASLWRPLALSSQVTRESALGRSFIDILLDAPSLVLKAEGFCVIDDHLLGEPRLEDGLYICERAADWSRRGGRRKLVPDDYPLVFRSSLDSHTGAACLELIDGSNRALASMIACSVPVTDVVTAVYWRYQENYRRLKRLTPQLPRL